MARFYLGNLEAADRGMWEALRALPDDYHVFIEFQIPDPQRQRQVDFLVIRENLESGCFFLLEVKNERRRVRGTINGPWQYEEVPGAWMPLFTSNRQDQNPLQQAYNTAMVMKNWLLSMQALIQDSDDPWPDPYQTLTVFPRLVLPFANRDSQLQIDRFTWRFDSYDEAVDSLTRFAPREAFPMSRQEIERLAEHLGVQPVDEPAASPTAGDDPNGMRLQLAELTLQLVALRQEIQALRLTLSRSPLAPGQLRPAPPHGSSVRSLDDVCEAMAGVVGELRENNRPRTFPNIHEGLIRRLGSFSPAAFGFQRFRDLVAEAERRGYVRIQTIGLNELVYLPVEGVPTGIGETQTEPGISGLSTSLLTLNRGDRVRVKVLTLPLHTKWMDPWAELTVVVRGDRSIPLGDPGLEVQVVSTKEQRTLGLTSKMVHLIPSFDVPPEFREERFILDDTQPWKQLKGDAVGRLFLPQYGGQEIEAEIVSVTPTGNIVANSRTLDQALIQSYEEARAAGRGAHTANATAPPWRVTSRDTTEYSALGRLLTAPNGRRAEVPPDPLGDGDLPSGITLQTALGEIADRHPEVLRALLQRPEFSQLTDAGFLSQLRPFTLERVCFLVSARPIDVLAAIAVAATSDAGPAEGVESAVTS